MKAPPLRNRIRNGTLAMLSLALALGILALPQVYRLSGGIRNTLYRNYISIEAARHMQAALSNLQLAARDGTLPAVLPANRDEFMRWLSIEEHDITEPGEADLARDIHECAVHLFDEAAAGAGGRHDDEFSALHERLERLVAINENAMFAADSRASQMGRRLTYEFAAGLLALLILGAALSWTLAWNISKPLDELADRLRSFSLRSPQSRLGEQTLAELQAVANEFNKMAERLEQFDKLNVNRLIYEKSKTEAIIESLEDGILMIDPQGVVAHINELAAIILGVEREDALGSKFDDLSSNHPHYLRVRNALLRVPKDAAQQVEIDLHVRGRDHTYLLKAVPLRHAGGDSLGTIVILQDITYLRDKDRARANLVATLSHELKTPLTSLALAAELLQREKDGLQPRQREVLAAVIEETGRINQIADGLLNLARGETAAIAVGNVELELTELVQAVVRNFTIQAEQKHVTLSTHLLQPKVAARGDPVKLSWVLSNLIGNALRYTPDGGSIEVLLEREGRTVTVAVADSGPGIAPEIRDHIFERFTQMGRNGFEAGSAGLGLAIVKDIVEAHGGRIFVDSSERGSKFTVELPIAADGP